jgi:subtilisin-like proprotein convertase family protein
MKGQNLILLVSLFSFIFIFFLSASNSLGQNKLTIIDQLKPKKANTPFKANLKYNSSKKSTAKYAEVEILLSDRCDLHSVSDLYKAPGSDLHILDNPERVIIQLPIDELKTLTEKGTEVNILRKFVLFENSKSQTNGQNADVAALEAYSELFLQGENDTDIPIPEWDWTFSEITITGAPVNAIVECLDVHYEITHPCRSDLEVDLTDENLRCEVDLWSEDGGCLSNINQTKTGITLCNGERVNQTWLLWAIDWWLMDTGYINYWWIKVYYDPETTPPETPANDDCNAAIPINEAEPYTGSTFNATGANDSNQSSCSYNDYADVWHSYTPTNTGLVTISLEGSEFDTTLAVFDICDGNELVCNDDSTNLQSEVTLLMNEGKTYLIRIAGYEGDMGDYTLTVNSIPPIPPYAPCNPTPIDGVDNTPIKTTLSWNCCTSQTNQAMNNQTITASLKSTTRLKTIFGKDDRIEEYEVRDEKISASGDSTAIVISRYFLNDNYDGTFSIDPTTFAEWYRIIDPTGSGNPLCPNEPFQNQPSPGSCSAFLVAPDIIATAGHCVGTQDCIETAVVFGFVMLDANTPVMTVNESEVYYCTEIIAHQSGNPDWGLIRLDREVTGHKPLPLRHTDIIPDDEPLLMIGYPYGIPRKYSAGATVRDNSASSYFLANLDAFDGSSGSVVLNTENLLVEGILYLGPLDFTQDGSCDCSIVCPDSGCPDWPYLEYVTRVTEFSAVIPVFDVYLGTNPNDPNNWNLICSGNLFFSCDTGSLRAGTKYYWQVISKNCYDRTEGPIWSFTTK